MRVGTWGIGVALALVGCGEAAQICLDDFDQDGLCGAADACPLDTLNDEDGDGVCGSVDICPTGSDFDDEDLDLLPDACDPCLADTLNDPDEDGVCGLVDKCPGDPTNQCERGFTIGVAVDPYYTESTWTMVVDGVVYDEGGFDSPGDGVYGTWAYPATAERVCIEVSDTYGDGGVRGQIWDDTLGLELQNFAYRDWSDAESFCFNIAGGEPTGAERPFDESDYLSGLKSCQAWIVIETFTWGSETGWTLLDSRGGVVASRAPGGYADYSTYTTIVDLYDAEWVFRMQDSYGDGWHGGTFEVRLSPEGEAIVTDSLPTGRVQDVPFSLECPDAEPL
jgi:hypothetical protein